MHEAGTRRECAPERTLLVGCGKLGTRLGARLVAAGGEVFGLRRSTGALPASFSPLAVDLSERVPRGLLPEVDAMVITLPPSATAGAANDEGYVRALEHLAEALPATPARVVLVSSTRVFEGRTDGLPITEADAPAPVTARGTALHEGERLATESLGAHIVRPAGIYGPGREMLVRKVLESRPVQYARRTNRIHETDLVRTLEAMLSAEDAPCVLHAVDQAPAPLGDIVTWIADRLGLRPPPRIEPEVVSGTVLRGERLLTLLGELRYPTFEAGYGELIAARERSEPTSES